MSRSKVLAKKWVPDVGGTQLGAVPVGETWIVKDIRLRNMSDSVVHVRIIAEDSTDSLEGWMYDVHLAAQTQDVWTGWVVLEGSDQLVCVLDGGPVFFWVSGAELLA